jgi:hypothetical protein
MGRQVSQLCRRLAHLLQGTHLQATTSQCVQAAVTAGSCRGICSCAVTPSEEPSTSGRQGQISAASWSLPEPRQWQRHQPAGFSLLAAPSINTFTWWQQRSFSAAQQPSLQHVASIASASTTNNSSSSSASSSGSSASTSQPPPPYWLPPRPNPSRSFKRPKDIVDPSSPALKHYRKQRQSQSMIIYRITKRHSLYMVLVSLQPASGVLSLAILAGCL